MSSGSIQLDQLMRLFNSMCFEKQRLIEVRCGRMQPDAGAASLLSAPLQHTDPSSRLPHLLVVDGNHLLEDHSLLPTGRCAWQRRAT